MKLRDRIRKWRQKRRERATSETMAEWRRKAERTDWIVACVVLAITIGGIAFGLIRYPDTTGCPISFGLSLGCMVYSILNLVRIHRKRKAANLLEPMTPEEFQRKTAKLEGRLDA